MRKSRSHSLYERSAGVRYSSSLVLMLLFLGSPESYGQTTLTYENWAEGFFTENCTLCHHSEQSGITRFGAPRNINFDTLDLIRQNAALIRDAVLSEDPYMPPAGVLWWWDRASLGEWMDAGMPGGNEQLEPVEVPRNQITLYYQSSSFYFSRPIDDDFNVRFLRFNPLGDKDDQVPPEYRVYVQLRPDGTVLMTRRVWRTEDGGTLSFDYSPGIPILLSGGNLNAPEWYSTVQVRERHWPRWYQGGGVEYENTTTEQWIVSNIGVETIDNAIILPLESLKVTQTNLTTSEEFSWWYAKGYGLVRRETDRPSTEWDRERIIEYNIFGGESDPLRSPPFIEAASEEWFPFVGPRHSSERTDLDYSYIFDVQGKGMVDQSEPVAPTETPLPLEPDPEPTPIRPTPTFTPVGSDPNNGGGIPNLDPNNPQISDLSPDKYIDSQDLLIFLKHWHKSIP